MRLNELRQEESAEINRSSYHLSLEALNSIEYDLAKLAGSYTGDTSTTVATVVAGTSKYADFGRTTETQTFAGYDFHSAMKPYEDRSLFIYTLDQTVGRIAHVKRIVSPQSAQERAATGLSGLEIIDDRVNSEILEERVALDDILTFHRIRNLDNSYNITTNMVTGRATPSRENPYSLLSYKALFNLCILEDTETLFAYLNELAIKSLSRLGVEYSLLAGKEFHLPEPNSTTKYDRDYKAVVIPRSKVNLEAFTTINPSKPFTRMIADRDVPLIQLY